MNLTTQTVILGAWLIGVLAAIAILILRPHEDNTQLIASVLGFLGTGSIALIDTLKTSKVHDLLNQKDDSK